MKPGLLGAILSSPVASLLAQLSLLKQRSNWLRKE